MCMPPAGSMQNMSARPADRRSAQAFMNFAAITDPSYVRSVYDKGGSEGFQQRFGPYDGGPKNPFGGGAYRALAKQQGREFDPADLFGEKAAQEKRFSALEQEIAKLRAAGVSTAATTGQTSTSAASKPKKFTTIGQAKNYNTKPSPTSMNTTSGLKTFGSLNGAMGLNTPN